MPPLPWAQNFVEGEGLARTTIFALFVTTIGCLAYTWGYYEGVHNTKNPFLIEGSLLNSSIAMEPAQANHVHGQGGHIRMRSRPHANDPHMPVNATVRLDTQNVSDLSPIEATSAMKMLDLGQGSPADDEDEADGQRRKVLATAGLRGGKAV